MTGGAQPRVHVLGAGLAGLAAAVGLSDQGHPVTLVDAAPVAGGRARSYWDRTLERRLDNGNHLLLSGNEAAFAWLRRLGTEDSLAGPGSACFPFLDLVSGERWTLRPGAGRSPLWLLDPDRRIPGTRPADYLALLRWLRPPAGASVAAVGGYGAVYQRLIEPLAIAALNTLAGSADAALMGAVVRQTLLRGGRACIPAFPRVGLSESLVDPAVALLRARGATIEFSRRVSAIETAGSRARSILTSDGPIALGPADQLVLAVPAPVAADLLPGLAVPDAFESILNVHYRIDAPPDPVGFLGLLNGFAEWVFRKPGVVSVTISAANRYADLDPDQVAARCWPEIRQALALAGPMPAARVVREKRASFAATPAQAAKRPATDAVALRNLALAGDWTATGLPATIEGALRSGAAAASLAARRIRHAP